MSAPTSENLDVNSEIRKLWDEICNDFPNATTPLVAKRVAEEFGIPVTRVFQAFGNA